MRLTVKSKKDESTPSVFWLKYHALLTGSLMYFFLFIGHGSYFTTLSPHMIFRFGEDARYVFFAGQLMFPFGYFFAGWFSDRTRQIRMVLVAFLLLQTPFQYYLFAPDLSLLGCIFASAVTRFFFAANTQLMAIAVLESVNFRGFSIGRSAGTFGFLVVQIAMFFFESIALRDAAPEIQGGRTGQWGALFMLVTAMFAFFAPARRRSHTEYFFRDAWTELRERNFLPFFGVSFLFYFSYQVVDYYLGGYLRTVGGMPFVYGGWGLAVLIEIPFMVLTGRIAYRYGVKWLFLLAILAGSGRFLALTLDVAVGLPGLALAQQVLHGIHFTGYYMGTVYLLRKNFPEHLYGTGMGLYMLLSVSAGATIGNLLTGLFLKGESEATTGYGEMFFMSLVLHLIVLIFFLFLSLPDQSARKSDSDHV